LSALAQEIERQQQSKIDYLANTDALVMSPEHMNPIYIPTNGHREPFIANGHAHAQIAEKVGIPKRYYDRMLAEQPELLATNVNTWFTAEPEKRLVRTLDGRLRAFLSDRYRVLDNFDFMSAVLPVLHDAPRLEIVSCEVTEKRLYIKAVFPHLEREITKSVRQGDIVQGGIVVSNSEVGCGGVQVQSMLYYLACLNGMRGMTGHRKYHVGQKQSAEEAIQELLSDETRATDDRAFWMKIQDVVRANISREIFDREVDAVEEAVEVRIEGDPVKVVKNVQKKFGFTPNLLATMANAPALLSGYVALDSAHGRCLYGIDPQQQGGPLRRPGDFSWVARTFLHDVDPAFGARRADAVPVWLRAGEARTGACTRGHYHVGAAPDGNGLRARTGKSRDRGRRRLEGQGWEAHSDPGEDGRSRSLLVLRGDRPEARRR